jgi:hypothetical protein
MAEFMASRLVARCERVLSLSHGIAVGGVLKK